MGDDTITQIGAGDIIRLQSFLDGSSIHNLQDVLNTATLSVLGGLYSFSLESSLTIEKIGGGAITSLSQLETLHWEFVA